MKNKNIKNNKAVVSCKKRVIKPYSELEYGEILLYNKVNFDNITDEILLYYDDIHVDTLNIHDLLKVFSPDTHEYVEADSNE